MVAQMTVRSLRRLTAERASSVRTFIAVDPRTRERSLLVEVHPETDRAGLPEELRAFEERMFDRNIRVGLYVTPVTTHVVRDLLTAVGFETNGYDEKQASTENLLRAAGLRANARGAEFVKQVRAWLEAVAASWSSFLPHDESFALFVPEVVGNLAQTNLEEWDDILGPDVYVETNWICACVVMHDDHHKAAKTLLKQAMNGECELRVPQAAVLESRTTVARVQGRLFKPLEEARNAIIKAYRNTVTDVKPIEDAIANALTQPGVRDYMNRDVEAERRRLLSNPPVAVFSDTETELTTMGALRFEVPFDGKDINDFYILTAVLADRDKPGHAVRPAILFSTNDKQFAKLNTTGLYGQRRVVYRSDFQLVAGLKDWTQAFP
jgi:hypothetical protein